MLLRKIGRVLIGLTTAAAVFFAAPYSYAAEINTAQANASGVGSSQKGTAETEDAISTILASQYYTGSDGRQRIDWYLVCDPYDNLYISRDLDQKEFICNFPGAADYKFGIRKNGDIIAVYRSEFSKAVTSQYGPELDGVRKNPCVMLSAENYKTIHTVEFGEYDADTGQGLKPCGWLENCGFCSLPDGDVLFAEYTRMGVVFSANCWRIKAGCDPTKAASWEIVKQFQVASDDKTSFDESVIEHFHTVQMDPYTGIVYIATGDLGKKSQMWYSRDNGSTWTQQTFTDPVTGKTLTSNEKFFRILNYNFTEDCVYWSSDSSRKHAILQCKRKDTGELDPDSIKILEELDMLEGRPATYGTVYYPEYKFMVLMERCDEAAPSMKFRVYDLENDTVKTIGMIKAAGKETGNVGFRTEYTEFDPPDGVIKVGFGSKSMYRNYNNLLGNPGDSDWTNNINNMWIKVYRDQDGRICAKFGFYNI